MTVFILYIYLKIIIIWLLLKYWLCVLTFTEFITGAKQIESSREIYIKQSHEWWKIDSYSTLNWILSPMLIPMLGAWNMMLRAR